MKKNIREIKSFKKSKYFILLIILIMVFNTTSFALENNSNDKQQNTSEELNLYCDSCALVEISTKKIAYEKNLKKKLYPASTTKLLTAIIVLDKCNLNDTVTITNNMVSSIPFGYTVAYLQPGETYTVEELLNLLLIPSANDAGYALAIHVSGSINSFADLMNTTAKELGCFDSNFTNPSGIHNANHYSTSFDLSLIGLKAIEYSKITEICAKKTYTLNNKTFNTTNTLIVDSEPNYYEFATGLKTGFTDYAGSCLIATAKKDNMRFLAVVLNCPKPTQTIIYKDVDCKNLFEYGFSHYNEIVPSIDFLIPFFQNIVEFKDTILKLMGALAVFSTTGLFISLFSVRNVRI